jgi:hypothetical protein
MSAVLDQWLGDSRHAIHQLEQEVSDHQIAIQHAMTLIRDHTAVIHHLQHHLEIIRRATGDVDAGLGAAEFEDSFQHTFGEEYEELESVESDDSSYSMLIDPEVQAAARATEEDTSVKSVPLRVMSGAAEHDARTRLPPPAPHYARARR